MNHANRLLILVVAMLYAGGGVVPSWGQTTTYGPLTGAFTSNDAFIEALNDTTVDIHDTKAMFDYFFSKLPEEITVYPSENYYYYIFPLAGRIFKGSLGLYPELRDSGEIDFGYMEKYDDARISDLGAVGNWMHIGKKQGLQMTKINPAHYIVSYRGKQMNLRLYQPDSTAPRHALLTSDERFVANTCDESGIKFHLVFNTVQKCLYWILNEDVFVPEQFMVYSDVFLIGKRTRFAFFNDTAHHRKMLVGVWLQNVLLNNWYDGPFDQMPDNAVLSGQVQVQRLLEQAYPSQQGLIDKFGRHTYDVGSRIPVAPYMVYNTYADLYFRLQSAKKYTRNHSELCASMTRQEFSIPDGFYTSIVNDPR